MIAAFVVCGEAVAQQAAPATGQDWEEEYSWALARRDGTPEAYQWFLDRYPSSRYRDLASQEVVEAIVAGSSAAKATLPVPSAVRNQRTPFEGAFADELDSSSGSRRR